MDHDRSTGEVSKILDIHFLQIKLENIFDFRSMKCLFQKENNSIQDMVVKTGF